MAPQPSSVTGTARRVHPATPIHAQHLTIAHPPPSPPAPYPPPLQRQVKTQFFLFQLHQLDRDIATQQAQQGQLQSQLEELQAQHSQRGAALEAKRKEQAGHIRARMNFEKQGNKLKEQKGKLVGAVGAYAVCGCVRSNWQQLSMSSRGGLWVLQARAVPRSVPACALLAAAVSSREQP